MSDTIDNATLRVAYERGAEARWREGFPEHMSLTDMERAAHTAGLREVLRLVPPPPGWSEKEIISLLLRFGRPEPEPIAIAERAPEGDVFWVAQVLARIDGHVLWHWSIGNRREKRPPWQTHWLPLDTPVLPARVR